jgi:acyl-CoA dehydrogenase
MQLIDGLAHLFFKTMVNTVMLPLRNQAFASTRKAKISDTEKEALGSGSIGFERELLSGQPDWRKLLDMPAPSLRPDEQAFLDGPVEGLCELLDDWKIRTELKDLPPEAWAFMKQHGFFGMIIPKEFDGLGFSARAHSEVIQKLASRSTTACVTAMVPNSLGPAELLIRYGTDAQKNYYLPRLAKGEEIPSFALTEPDAGSDASSMTSRGVVCMQEGQLGIRLTWDKRYITLSPITTLLGIAFKLMDPEGLLGDKKEWGITLALVPVETPGVTTGKRHNPLGIPFQNGPTQGKDVWIPIEQIIGGREYAGQGWRMLMECLSVGRCISLPALSVGSAKLVCRITGAYSRSRKQFKVNIGQFEGVEELIARMTGTTYMMEAARMATLQMLDRGEHPTILSAVLKYHMTECGRQIVNDGMDILGGKAICEGPDNLISPIYHGIPIGITVEGANILTRNMIIFGQGSVRSHPYLLQEIEAARLPDAKEAKRKFSDLMAQHVGMSVRNGINSVVYGLLDGHLSAMPQNCSNVQAPYFRHINRLSAAYATVADMTLMLLGDTVKRKERISALLGDTLSYLFLAACVLRHYNAQGQLTDDLPMMHWACQHMLYLAEESMDKLLQNFPNPVMGTLLRPVIFPKGRQCRMPAHRLDRKVAQIALNPGAARDRLTAGIYLPQASKEPLAQLERCMETIVAAEPLEALLRQAKKDGRLQASSPEALMMEAMEKEVLSKEGGDTLKRAETLRQQVIQVDDFDPDFGMIHTEPLALADRDSLKGAYPVGIQWNVEIPKVDLVQFMQESLTRYKNHPCIDFLGKKYTYHEVEELIHKAAAGLQAQGVTKGDKIGLYMPNSPYYPILFFAALKVGAVAVNFCPMHTVSELRHQALDSGTRLLVTLDLKDMYDNALCLQKEGTLDQLIVCRMDKALPFLKAQAYRLLKASNIARIEEDDKRPQGQKAAAVLMFKELVNNLKPLQPVAIFPEDVAVLQYTGGTTGTPKGAMLTHANLVANAVQVEEYFRASADKPDCPALLKSGCERVLASIPYFHVFGMTVTMITGMRIGGELLIIPNPRDMKETLKVIQEKRPTMFPAVPRLLQAISENPKGGTNDLSCLETVISGGAALPPNMKETFETASGKSGLLKQGYGLTETSPVVTSNPAYGLNKSGSVGLPLPRTQIRITHPENPDCTLRIGEIGEICISGPQVMKGYYNRPEETAEVLRDGWLRTGDLGYLDEDYYLHIVDRIKRLILVNGFNVYPTQIENAIAQHPAVAECMVISVPDPRSGEAAKAFIRLKPDFTGHLTAKEMRLFLKDQLSRIELPKYFEFVTVEILKTAVGKPDWRRMQEQDRLKHVEYGGALPEALLNYNFNEGDFTEEQAS